MNVDRSTRDGAYLEILARGLLRLRDAARAGEASICLAESEHLHNLPSLVAEPNEQRHIYYFDSERAHYVQTLQNLGAADYLENAQRWYHDAWMVLANALGKTLD